MAAVLVLSTSGCRTIAVALAPSRVAEAAGDHTERGERLLAAALLEGRYDRLPDVIEGLTRLSVLHPRDGRLHTALGMAHLWRASERGRLADPSPRLTDSLVLARHYLTSARQLVPQDARVHAWRAGTWLATAALTDDQRLRREGFFEMKDAVSAYPEFNLFSASYVFSRLPADDGKYRPEVVAPMFEALRRCYGAADDWDSRADLVREGLAEAAEQPPETRTGPDRVCFPSALAPHNIEGFFLHFGDVLSKDGRLDDARRAWGLASLAPDYDRWPYRDELEARLADPEAHSAVARAGRQGEGMMITSTYSCVGCHQR